MFPLFTLQDLPKHIALIVLHVLLAKLMVTLFASNDVVGFLWLASGVALAAVLLGGNKYLPAVFLGALLGYLLLDRPLIFALVAALRHTTAIFLGIWLLKKEGRFDPALHKLGDFLRILVLALGIGLFSALVMQLFAWLGAISFAGTHSFNQRWTGHALGIIVIMPLVLVWRQRPRQWIAAEAMLIIGLSFLVGQVVFLDWLHDSLGRVAGGYWLFLFITWAAVRLGLHGTVLILAIVAIQGVAGAQLGTGFFAKDIARTQLANYFFYIFILSVVGMALSTYFTERKQGEEKLRQARDRLTLATHAGGVGIWDLDLTRNVLTWDEQMFALYGVTRAQFAGAYEAWKAGVLPEDVQQADAEVQMALRGEKDFDTEFRVLWPSGTIRSIRALARVERDPAGRPLRMIGTNWDITERKQAEAEILRSNRELEQFSYSVSHDMRQPLRMISSYLQLLEMSLAEQLTDEKREYFHFAIDGAKRMDAMMLGLLDYSRVGRKGEPPAWVDSRAVLDEALLFLQPAIAEAHGKVHIEGSWPRILVSPDEMLRLLQNLIGNALKFRVAERLPEVSVSSETVGNLWRVRVTDNGIGILPDQISRLFQVFQRLQSRATYEGTGIGLALCRKIAEHHGGRIWAESAGEGLGSRFIFELPLNPAPLLAENTKATTALTSGAPLESR